MSAIMFIAWSLFFSALNRCALAISLALLSPSVLLADQQRFCLRKIDLSPDFEPASYLGVRRIIEAKKPEHNIYFLKVRWGLRPARLVDGVFMPVTEGFPTGLDYNDIIVTPNGQVIGFGGRLGKRFFFKMDDSTGRFQKVEFGGFANLSSARKIVWSTPVSAPLVTISGGRKTPDNGAIISLKNGTAKVFSDLPYWFTHIADFPQLELTVLVTHMDERIFVIDANQNLHELTELKLGKWMFISGTYFVDSPPRIVVEASEAMGPYRGLYQVTLEQMHGIWKPSDEQDWVDHMKEVPNKDFEGRLNGSRIYDKEHHRYFFVGNRLSDRWQRLLGWFWRPYGASVFGLYRLDEDGFVAEDISDPDLTKSLPRLVKFKIDRDLYGHLYDQESFELPDSKATVILSDKFIRVIEADGTKHDLDRSLLGTNGFSPVVGSWALKNRGEVLIFSNQSYFLLRDRKLAGQNACG